MADISYVCLSDMHLGEEDSLLTNIETDNTHIDPIHPAPVMERLVECLRYLISKNEGGNKPTLILNGDILELALTTTNEAAMVFERFIELIMPQNKELFDNIIYIPGNHDHHLWEMARETQYVEYISREFTSGKELPIPWHTTNMFVENDPNPVPSYFLTKLVKRYPNLKDFTISTAYPNFGIFKDGIERCVVFHHGHFIEWIYQLMSTLKSMIFPNRKIPRHIWEIEAENFAWIDFFWSTMGRSGEAGKDIELIYETMYDIKEFKKLLNNLAKGLAERHGLPRWIRPIEAQLLKLVLNRLTDAVAGTERGKTDSPLSEDAKKGLFTYMNGPIKEQLLIEIDRLNLGKDILTDATIIIGHTHKPFEEVISFKEYPAPVNVYNTGGWVVESVEPQPLHGGAVVLVDDDLNVVSLRMFNEEEDPEAYLVKVEEATPGNKDNPLYRHIKGLVDPSSEPWRGFSAVVAEAVSIRARNLKERIGKKV